VERQRLVNRRWFFIATLVAGVLLVVGGLTLMFVPYTVEIGQDEVTYIGVFTFFPSDPVPATDPHRDVRQEYSDKAWASGIAGLGLLIVGAGSITLIVAARRPRRRRPHPEPAWFPDPDGSANLRWWDGHQWTEHRSS
jgi:hypothetical protein